MRGSSRPAVGGMTFGAMPKEAYQEPRGKKVPIQYPKLLLGGSGFQVHRRFEWSEEVYMERRPSGGLGVRDSSSHPQSQGSTPKVVGRIGMARLDMVELERSGCRPSRMNCLQRAMKI